MEVEYSARLRVGKTQVSLHSSRPHPRLRQVRIEHEGTVWVVSGDYNAQPDPTCTGFEQLQCDVFISEATFASAHLSLGSDAGGGRGNRALVARESGPGRSLTAVLLCLGEGAARTRGADSVHERGGLSARRRGLPHALIYRQSGVEMVPTLPATTEKKTDYRGALIIAPPSAAGTPWTRRFGEHSSGILLRMDASARRQATARIRPGLRHLRSRRLACAARHVHRHRARSACLTHGHSDALTRYLNERGVNAAALATAFGDED